MGAVLNPASSVTAVTAGMAFERYLHWAASVEWNDVPLAARSSVVLVLADNLAATFSAQEEPQVALSRQRMLAAVSGGPASLLVPGRPRVSVLQAAMGNGLAMGWNELDEGYRKAVCHAGLYVLPALLACAEAEGSSLKELLRAALLAYETVTRIACSWRFPAMLIHPHALLAPVGAAAGVGFLRRLPADELLSAIAGAATMGMVGPFNHALQGVLARNTWAAQGAASGLAALEWAHCGIGGQASTPHDVYATALGAKADLSPLVPHADAGWAVEAGYHKMSACCQYAHSTIEAVQMLLAKNPNLKGGEQLTSIQVETHPLGYALADRRPSTTLGAKFSVPHAVAAALVHGDGGVASFDTASLGDPRIARLRDMTRLVPFPEVRPWPDDRPARVTVTCQTGEKFDALCWSAQGGPDRPFSEYALWNKVAELSQMQAPRFTRVMREIASVVKSQDEAGRLMRPWSVWLDDIFREDAPDTGATPIP
ncbi:MAG: MmgE/PrpD family protein [Polaromonas sp.]